MRTTLILIALGVAAVCAVPIVQDVQYMRAEPKDLLKPLDDIIAEIKAEAKEDQDQIDADKSKHDNAIKEQAEEKKDMDNAKTVMDEFHKKLDDQTTLERKRKEEYAANNEVRAQEQQGLTKVKAQLDSLIAVGPADGVMGKLPASKVIVEALQEMSSMHPRKEYQDITNELQRGSSDTTAIANSITAARASITAEDKKDAAEVKVQVALTRKKLEEYNQKKSEHETAVRLHEEAIQRTEIAKKALDSSIKEKEDADKLRAEELKTIEEAKKMVTELINVRQPAGLEDLQTEIKRANSATEKLKTILKTLRQDVNMEETMQLRLLNMMKAAELKARMDMKKAETKWNAQKIATKAAYKKYESAHGEWEGSEMALAQEQAVAREERKTINEVRAMLKKLEAATLKTLGNCPEDKDGTPCSGNGECVKNSNGLGAKCQCTGFGKTGFDCSLCKFGFKDVNGACTKVFETAVSFLQVDGKDYTADDLNDLISNLQEGRVHAAEQSGIEKLLKQLEAKLDAQEKLLIEEATKAKDVRDIFNKHWEANKTQEAIDKKDFEVKTLVWKKAFKRMKVVQTMYDLEHPLRMKELKIITLLDDIIARLEGKKVYNGTPAPSAQATKSTTTTTSAPTTK